MMTSITNLYQALLLVVPEHMSAINVCLVAGNLRPATLVEPDKLRGVPVRPWLMEPILNHYGLLSESKNDGLLVFNHRSAPDIEQLALDPDNDILFGRILGYRCLGEFKPRDVPRYFVNFVIPNPQSGNDNPFLSYVCVDLPNLDDLRSEGRQYRDFFQLHSLASRVKLYIWSFNQDMSQQDFINEWL